MNMMATAREEVAEFVGKKNRQQRGGKREACKQSQRIFEEQSKGAKELVEGSRFVLGVSGGELRTGREASAER